MSDVGRPALTREIIAVAALDLIDTDGLVGLSMRKLGARLGVEAMSLYHYVTNKDDLLDLALERVFLEVEIPELDDPAQWESVVRDGLGSFRAALRRHIRAMPLVHTQPVLTPGAFAVYRAAFERLSGAGLSPQDAQVALHILLSFLLGHLASTTQDGPKAETVGLSNLDDAEPGLIAFVESGRDLDPDLAYEAGLSVLLVGLRDQFQLP